MIVSETQRVLITSNLWAELSLTADQADLSKAEKVLGLLKRVYAFRPAEALDAADELWDYAE